MAYGPTQAIEQAPQALSRPVMSRPIFVGGFPGSGTAVVGTQLLGRHHKIGAGVPAEHRFLTEPGGLCDVVAGHPLPPAPIPVRITAALRGLRSPATGFEQRLLGLWYRAAVLGRPTPPSLADALSHKEILEALADYRRHRQQDPAGAARILAADVIEPPVRAAGKVRWVDSAPANCQRLEQLYRIFPDLSFVHVVRDGRAVAVQTLGPHRDAADYERLMREWGESLRATGAAMLRVPLGRAHTVWVDRLFGPDGQDHYERLLDFLGVYDSPKMRAFWVRRTRRAAFGSQWRLAMSARDLAPIDDAYAQVLQELAAAGVPTPAPV